jgi:hypothetical protein
MTIYLELTMSPTPSSCTRAVILNLIQDLEARLHAVPRERDDAESTAVPGCQQILNLVQNDNTCAIEA